MPRFLFVIAARPYRHSRAGGNPRRRWTGAWIPACAGMTVGGMVTKGRGFGVGEGHGFPPARE